MIHILPHLIVAGGLAAARALSEHAQKKERERAAQAEWARKERERAAKQNRS